MPVKRIDAIENGLPLLEDEIQRKTCETIEWLCEIRGKLTDREWCLAFTTIDKVIAGLVDRPLQEAIWKEANDARRAHNSKKAKK